MLDPAIKTRTTTEPLTEDEIAAADFQALRRMSKAAGLGVSGKADEIRGRLLDALARTTKTHTNARTRCKTCLAPVVVRNTRRTKMDDGRTLVTRSVRCTGKHRHTDTLKEIEA